MKLTPFLLLVTFGLGIYLGFGSESDQIRHQSFFSTKEFFDEAYSAADATPSKEGVKMILVNHHLLAKDLIAEAFNTVSNPPKTVVLISPNHFGVGQFNALTSEVNWDTPYGVLGANQGVIRLLENSGSVQIDPVPFNYEHGVSGIVPFVKHSFPRANIVPIIIKEKLKPDEAEKLSSVLSEVIPDNSLIIWSVDMSHYMDEATSLAKDNITIAALENNDADELLNAEVDSPIGLYMTARWAEIMNLNFNLLARSSAAIITGNNEAGDNTSYITGYWSVKSDD